MDNIRLYMDCQCGQGLEGGGGRKEGREGGINFMLIEVSSS